MTAAPTEPPRYRGRALDVRPGETLVQALARRGELLRSRSIKFHRPRAPFCGIGACSQCLVRVNGQPNIRACRYEPVAGDQIHGENAWPSARLDLLGAFDFLFYRGLDTLHGFRRPRWATPLFHRVVRRLSGYGRLASPGAAPRPGGGETLETETVVIGAGASGVACADRLRAEGRSVHVVDRTLPSRSAPAGSGSFGFTAAFLPPSDPSRSRPFTLLASREDGRGLLVRASRVVVATGGYDAGLLFDGNDRPGVLTAEAAFEFAGASGSSPFRHAVVIGGDERAGEVLDRFGPQVEAVVAPGPIAPGVAERASRLDIPLYPRTLLLGTTGRSRVRSVGLRPRGSGATFQLPADAVLLAHRRLPHSQLLFQSGARMEWRAETGAYYPVLENEVATSVPGLYCVGQAAGFRGAAGARDSGVAAAEAILGRTPSPAGPRVDSDRPGDLLGYLTELRPLLSRRRRPVLCPCEDILLSEIEHAHRAGYRGIEVVKRYTGVGTGLCQGRYCLPDTLLLLSILEGRPPSEVGFTTQRPPVFPAPLDALAGVPLPPEVSP